ncbi:ABC transporter substrate-binding protein [Actinomadura rudentiformis]|uniref:Uncharacterized protein n=1 Tax=Actinomadura rudentiformis TaxID=359158 RepID=A0A6H9YN68_9ACTN|nr:ABC transporter substrate-binding protein [Actinomadura rudentiformis]KAB2342069.1 hypothetical protein F8566_38990 [Actinomadura rudentiformis]
MGGDVTRLEGLLSLFQRLRERPTSRAGDRLRPLLLTIGTPHETRQVAHFFVEECMADGGPYSHITADGQSSFTDLALLLRHVSRDLSAHRPRFEPALRFPLLSMALWLLELRRMRLQQEQAGENEQAPRFSSNAQRQAWQLAGDLRAAEEDAHRRTLLGRGIRRRRQIVVPAQRPGERGRLASALVYLEQVAPIGVAVVALLSAGTAATLNLATAMLAAAVGIVFIAGQITARTRDWAGRRRYRWFTASRQTYLRGNRSSDFLGLALDVFFRDEPDPGTPLDDELERLLVAAFLQDLRHGYRRSIWRANWARVRYPVVVIDLFPAGHPSRDQTRRFVERVEELRRHEERFDPLVVVFPLASADEAARLAGSIRVPLAQAATVDLGMVREYEEGNPFWNEYLAEQRRVAVLGTRRAFQVDLGAGDGSSTEPIHRGRRRPWVAHPAMPWIAMGAILVASVTVITLQTVRYCSPVSVWHADNGECIGITDGSHIYAKRLAGVEKRIHRLNKDAVSSGKPYVTIVYLGPMTTDPQDRSPQADLMAGVHGELVGLSIAQEKHNEANGQPRLRILLANSGSRFRYAKQVADHIRKRAGEDPRIVAVIGFGQSRRQTDEAIDVLGKSALPMIGTTNTYDLTARRKTSFSPYYFRLAPSNWRLARHAAYWSRNGQLDGLQASSADVFYDASRDDRYSQNLARDFADAFKPGKVRIFAYSDPSQVPGKVEEACAAPAQLFYYAGRSDEFRSFINKVANTSCGGPLVVLGGDEVTKYVSDNGAELGRTDTLRLYYTPLAAKEAWDRRWVGGRPLQTFYTEFEPVVDSLVGRTAPANVRPSRTHAAIGYDAARTIINVAERIFGEQARTLPTAAAILSELTEPDQRAFPQGASGLLRFGPRTTGHAVEQKPVVLAKVEKNGATTVLQVCGHLVDSGQQGASCPPNP